jgi:hypothetical protein
VTNIGNSPAIKLTFHHKLVVLAEGVSIPSEHEQVCEEARRQWQGGFTLFPNEQFPRSIGASQLSIFADAPKEAIERGLKSGQHVDLIVVGCVDYTFPTDPDTHHQTPFIRQLIRRDVGAPINIDDNMLRPEQLMLREFADHIVRAAD